MIEVEYKYHGSRNLWNLSFTDQEKLNEWLTIFKPFIDYRIVGTDESFKINVDGFEFEQMRDSERLDLLFKKVHALEKQLRYLNGGC